MPSKPDKFGIKFWLLVDCTSKYVIDGFPYLGKDDERAINETLPDHVVKLLMKDHLDVGYNVTMDNFFTSKQLADYLKSKKTTILGKTLKIRLCTVHAHWPISMQFNELLQERYVLIEGNYREIC